MNARFRRATRLLLLALFLVAAAAPATEPVRVFTPRSYDAIVAAHAGKPFVLACWSVTCPHCPTELRALGRLKRAQPGLEIVLVAADTPADAPLAAQLAREFGLGDAEQWVFDDDIPERLRLAIDARWHGELPRTYFFDAAHRVTAHSGVLAEDALATLAAGRTP